MSIKELQYSYREFQMHCVLKTGLLLSGTEQLFVKEITGDGETLTIPDFISVEDYDVQGTLYSRTLPVCGLAERACYGKSNLRRVELGCNIRQLGTNAFAQCKALETVVWSKASERNGLLLEADVFFGCHRLRTLDFCSEQKKELARMLAEAAISLSAQYLLEMDEIGSANWYNIWDGCLLSYIKKPEEEGYAQFIFDAAYLPFESYLQEIRQKKIELAIFRLRHPDFLESCVKKKLEAYLCACAKGTEAQTLWHVIADSYAEDREVLCMLQECGVLDGKSVDALLASTDSVQLRGYLLQYKQTQLKDAECFAMFQL